MEASGTKWNFDECGQSAHNLAVTRTLVNNLMGLQPPPTRPDEAEQQRSVMEKRVETRFKSCRGKHSGSASLVEVRERRNKKSKIAKRVLRVSIPFFFFCIGLKKMTLTLVFVIVEACPP